LLQYFTALKAYKKATPQELPAITTLDDWADLYRFRLALVWRDTGFAKYLASRPQRWRLLAATPDRGTVLDERGAELYERIDPP
jgi:hypothetical protein